MAPSSKGPRLRRPGDPPARYGPLEDKFTVEINYGGFFCGFGSAKSYVDAKVARFDECDADTWSPLWLTDFMEQLGYKDPNTYMLYWLLPGLQLDTGLRIVDCDKDTLSMIAVVPKFQYFQMFVHHKDMMFETANIDDVVISGSPVLPGVLSPKSGSCSNVGRQQQNVGQEPRRSRRKLMEEDDVGQQHSVQNCNQNGDTDSDDSDFDEEWVDSDNEVAEDDDDLYEEFVDDKLEEKKRGKSKLELDSDFDTDLEEPQGSDVEDEESADEVEVVDKHGKKQTKKKVKLRRWRPEDMKQVEFRVGMKFLSVQEIRTAIQEYIVQQRVAAAEATLPLAVK